MLGVVRCAGLLQAPLRSPPTLPRALALTATPHKVAAPAAAAREEQPSTVKPVSEVPGPRSFPFVGTIPSMLLDKSFKSTKIHLYFKKMTEMYGPIFKFSQPFNPPTVFVVRPDDTEAVVRATMDNPIRDGFTSFQKIRKEAADNYFENKTGLLTENGEEWWRVRSRVQTPMLRVKELLHYLPLMDQITMEFMDRIADKNIRETEAALLAKTASDGEDLTLMEALLVKPGLSRKDVVTLILDMLIAGIDTTSHTLAFTLYLLARNPEVQARLQKEVDVVLGNHKGPLTQHHLAQLSYLKAVVKESMRVFPIVLGMGRTLDKDLVLSGYLIPKGWMVAMLGMLMGWDESLFPRAKEFIPERWLRHKPLGPIHPYATLPFGAGTRMCIGRRIAEQEMFTFLARAMQRFTVGYEYEDLELVSRLVFIPSRPLKFTFTQRN
ncbi:probable cytochrome P450 49a1 isoform X2 [Procambarus clarkii]|uniref:probable cytochrome P450 49a1 isoform X2 n=1 Tax=Procambarus clarkii TaxID=6728 RepID=UPI003743A970